MVKGQHVIFFKLEHERVARNSVSSILDSNDVEVFSR